MTRTCPVLILATLTVLGRGRVLAQADVEDIPSREIELVAKNAKKGAPALSYSFIGPKTGAQAPASGFGLLLVLPGGSGGRDFNPFVKRIYQNALDATWIAAQPIAPEWPRSREIVWPTGRTPGRGAVPSTEAFIENVITHVAKQVKLDPARVFALVWSSSGPAAYAVSLQRSKSVTGFFIAMSVFKPDQLPPLKEAKGEAFYLYHSPDDATCAFTMAQQAEQVLTKAGAKVKLETYPGGHGWHGNIYESIRAGIQWLEANHAPPDTRMWPAARSKPRK